jgi:hypothetical protein
MILDDTRLLKSDIYIWVCVSTHISRCSEEFHIQLVFKFCIVIILYYIPYHIMSHPIISYIILHYITLHYIILYYIILYYIILYYVILYYIILGGHPHNISCILQYINCKL